MRRASRSVCSTTYALPARLLPLVTRLGSLHCREPTAGDGRKHVHICHTGTARKPLTYGSRGDSRGCDGARGWGLQAEQNAELTVQLRAARAEAEDAVAAAAAAHLQLREAQHMATATTTTEPTATEAALVKQVRALCVHGCPFLSGERQKVEGSLNSNANAQQELRGDGRSECTRQCVSVRRVKLGLVVGTGPRSSAALFTE
jgi:hypothetical protein